MATLSDRIIISLKLIIFLMLIVLISCSSSLVKVPLSASKYKSNIFKSEFSQYEGTQIYLEYIDNKAENTSIFYYYSPDGKIQYGDEALTSYFWYCFRSGLEDIGMGVYEDPPSDEVPSLNLTFFSLTDREFKFTIVLRKSGFLLLKKQYIVEMEESATMDKIILENKAYQLIDLTLQKILSDEEFQKAFFGNSKNVPQK